jgi:hypothetical protein
MSYVVSGSFGDETMIDAPTYKVDEDDNLIFLTGGRRPREVGRVKAGEWTAVLPVEPEPAKPGEEE